MNDLKIALNEKCILVARLDTLNNEFETSNGDISVLEQSLDNAVFLGTTTDIPLAELTSASLHRDSLRRVIGDIRENMIPAADRKIVAEEEKAIEDIQTACQALYDKCKTDILKKMGDVFKIIQTFDAECQKIEEEVGLVIGWNHPVFYVQESDRLQFSD